MAKNQNKKKTPEPKGGNKFNSYWLLAVIFLGILAYWMFNQDTVQETSQKQFFTMLQEGDVEKIVIVNQRDVNVFLTEEAQQEEEHEETQQGNQFGGLNTGPHYTFEIGSLEVFADELEEAQANLSPDQKIMAEYETQQDWLGPILSWVLPIGLLILLWLFIMRRMSGGMGGAGSQIFNIGKSKANLYDKNTQVNVTFNDVAGLEEAKEEVMEVVDFLKNPKKYTALGGKIPKGVLLVGPPGTGKTLIAKAMAGEAQVPFFSISGSDFVEMFVGVGASRVRDLFKQAREKAPCIIFIDEIDAIGRARGKQLIQGNDERENTLNQLLVEMDGFSSEKGVIIVAATNRPDVLDTALLRPGRFDRQIAIDKPDLVGREQIFKVHLKPIKVSDQVDPKKLAQQTPGFVGADIANICNEAALIAARRNKNQVDMKDFQDAIDRSIGGLEKKNKLISPEEKKIIAYHEAGHAIAGWFLEHADPLLKVSIVPRGVAALGYAQYLPKEQYLMTTEQLLDRICKTLGGRAAERIIFDKISTGAQNDLDVVTKMAYAMVTVYGMTEKVGHVSFYDMQNEYGFSKPYSDNTARLIDEQVKLIIDTEYQRAIRLLTEKRDELEKLAKELLKKEVLFKDDLEALVGKRPYDDKHEHEHSDNGNAADKDDFPVEEKPKPNQHKESEEDEESKKDEDHPARLNLPDDTGDKHSI